MITQDTLEQITGRKISEEIYDKAIEITQEIIAIREQAGERTSELKMIRLLYICALFLEHNIEIIP